MKNPRVWVDRQGDPWIEIEPEQAACITPWLRQAIEDKVGLVPVEDVQELYELRQLSAPAEEGAASHDQEQER